MVSGAFVELSGSVAFKDLVSSFDNWRRTSSKVIAKFGVTDKTIDQSDNSTSLTGAAAQVLYQMLDHLVDTPENETWSLRLFTHSSDLWVGRLTKAQMEKSTSTRPFRLVALEGAAPFFRHWIRNYFEWDENKQWLAVIVQRNFDTREDWDNYARTVGESSGPALEAKNLVMAFAGLVLSGTVDPSAEQIAKVSEAIKKGTNQVVGK
jgi:hypothetical protein